MSNIIETVLDKLEKFDGKADVILSNGSIGSVLSNFIVTPRIVISDVLKNHDDINKIVDFNMNVFAMIYKRTFDILLSVYGYEAKFAIRTLGNGTKWTLEDLKTEEPSYTACAEKNVYPLELQDISLEKGEKIPSAVQEIELKATVVHPNTGKTATIELTMLVKASIEYLNVNDIYSAIETNGDNVSFSVRYNEWRSGEITFKNLMLSDDILREYKKSRIRNKSDFLKFIEERRRANIKSLAKRQTVDLSKLFQMIIITEAEKKKIEKMVKGSMDKTRVANKVLDNLLSLSLTSVDDDYEMIDFYLNELGDKMEVPFNSLDSGNKNANNDIIKWLMTQK